MAYLETSLGGGQRQLELDEQPLVIGRSRGCGLVLDGLTVSRQHARITGHEGRFQIEDLNSRDGTLVNGERVTGSRALIDGDTINICDYRFVFFAGSASSKSKEPPLSFSDPIDSNTMIMSTIDVGARRSVPEVHPEAKLRALLEINGCLRGTLRVEELLPKVLDRLFHIFPVALGGFVLLKDDESGELVPKTSRNRDGSDASLRMSRTVVRQAFEREQGILSTDTASDDLFKSSDSISSLGIRSVMCVPLMSPGGDAFGVLQLHAEEGGHTFSTEDLDLLVSVGATTAMALENVRLHHRQLLQERMQRDVELASDVQRRFLPARNPEVPGYSFFAHYDSAYSVGGDYYGYVDLPGGRIGMAIGDVSGKGVPAAMLMARLSSDVRYSMTSTPDVASAMGMVNVALAEAEIDDKFVTLLLMVLDPKEHTVTLASAGHLLPVLRDCDGELTELGRGTAGMPLNVDPRPEYTYRQARFDIEPGSAVLCYTDGITDTQSADNEWYGMERLYRIFATAPPGAVAAGGAILDDVRAFGAGMPAGDDLTLLCFGREV